MDKEICKGDVFRWHWNDYEFNQRKLERQAGTLYWCCSNICIVDSSGKLVDTYWHSTASNKVVDPSKCDLEYLGNINDYREADRYEFDYYNDEDILNISHSNNTRGGCYIKKDAEKSLVKAKMRVQQELDRKCSEINSLNYDIRRLNEMLQKEDVEDIFI